LPATTKRNEIQSSRAVKRSVQSGYDKRCEIQCGNQELAVMLGKWQKMNLVPNVSPTKLANITCTVGIRHYVHALLKK